MDFYQWLYDVPGNLQGIVVAQDRTEARDKVMAYLIDKFGHCDSQLICIRWRSSASDGICEIDEM